MIRSRFRPGPTGTKKNPAKPFQKYVVRPCWTVSMFSSIVNVKESSIAGDNDVVRIVRAAEEGLVDRSNLFPTELRGDLAGDSLQLAKESLVDRVQAGRADGVDCVAPAIGRLGAENVFDGHCGGS